MRFFNRSKDDKSRLQTTQDAGDLQPQRKGEDTKVVEKGEESQYPKALLITIAICFAISCIPTENTFTTTTILQITDTFHNVNEVGTATFQHFYSQLNTFISLKWLFLATFTIFEVSSTACGSPPSLTVFIIGREAAGFGSGRIFSCVFFIVASAIMLGKRAISTMCSTEYEPCDEKNIVERAELPDYNKTWPNDLGFDTVREERTPIDLPVAGKIPLYAAGTIYRNGPGANVARDAKGEVRHSCSHWFDGFAQMHRFELIPGMHGISQVRYSSRFSVDSLMDKLGRTGTWNGITCAQKRDPCETLFRKVMCLFTPLPKMTPQNCNVPVTVTTNQIGFPTDKLPAGHRASKARFLVARTDETHLKALDRDTLEPIGIASQKNLHPLLNGPMSASHAQTDPVTGDVFNYNLDFSRFAIYRVFKTSAATGETTILATISTADVAPAYMHSFLMSENYIILCVWGAHLKAYGLGVLWEKNIVDALAPFDDSKPVKWFVIDRFKDRGVVAQFESPAAFCFHTVNAYEEPAAGGPEGAVDLVCDLVEYANIDVMHKFYYENLRSSSPVAARWIVDKQDGCNQRFVRYRLCSVPASGDVPRLTKRELEQGSPLPLVRKIENEFSIPSPTAGDLPVINPAFIAKSYRYVWTCTTNSQRSTFFDGLSKIDLSTGQTIYWNNPQGHSPGEAIFIADPEGSQEDDGVLLTIVLDGFQETSYLLCLDARTMEEMGRADCLGVIPFLFHGQHVKQQDID